MSRFAYTLLIYLLLPLTPFKLLWRSLRQPQYLKHWDERYGFYQQEIDVRPIIWLHCVSVGETQAAAPLVKALQNQYPKYRILLTHATPTGRAAALQLFGDSVIRCYLPYDTPAMTRRFLQHFKPKFGVLMETELWFNLIASCKQEKIPLLLLNARMSEKSARGYARFRQLTQTGLQSLVAIAAQTNEDALRFKALGAQYVSVEGNLKFDVKPPKDAVQNGQALRKVVLAGKRPIFVAASTRKGEEKRILEAVKGLDLLTIIVPRHPNRFNQVEYIIRDSGLSYQRRTNLGEPLSTPVNVVLGDSMGEMFTYYAAADFAFVGGSLMKYGGQNLIEPASLGKPVIVGRHTFNFAEATQNAIRSGAAIRVKSTEKLREQIEYLMINAPKRKKMGQQALAFSRQYTGATERLVNLLAKYLD